MRSLNKLLYPLSMLAMGAVFGWWLRGPANLLSDDGLPEQVSAPASSFQQAPPSYQESRADEAQLPLDRREAFQKRDFPTSKPEPQPPGVNPLEQFQTLLSNQSFSAAMDLYRELDRRGDTRVAQLKKQVLAHLQRYLREEHGDAFTDLADAFLSRYYNDIDVMLLVAWQQRQSGYLMEAAQTFQLAFDYALTRPAQHRQVKDAFTSFVTEIDATLANQARWQKLIRFYESLRQLGVARPQDELRQAELYLHQDEWIHGRRLLQRLTANPTVASQAQALLEGMQETEGKDRPAKPDRQALALETIGQHFHLPLRVNNATNIRLLLDTGASVTTLSTQAFEAIRHRTHFTELGPHLFNTAGGPSKGTMYQVDSLQLGRHRLTNVRIAVLDFEMPEGVDGLLGMNVLQQFRFQVDQDAQTLLLQPR